MNHNSDIYQRKIVPWSYFSLVFFDVILQRRDKRMYLLRHVEKHAKATLSMKQAEVSSLTNMYRLLLRHVAKHAKAALLAPDEHIHANTLLSKPIKKYAESLLLSRHCC